MSQLYKRYVKNTVGRHISFISLYAILSERVISDREHETQQLFLE